MKLDKNKISIEITARIGSVEMSFDDFINLDVGSKLKIKDMDESNIKLFANGTLIGKGELTAAKSKIAVVLNDKY